MNTELIATLQAPSITALYAGLLGIGLTILTLNVIRLRRKHRISFGSARNGTEVEAMTRAVRAHGNFVETVPFTLLLLLIYEIAGGSPALAHLAGCSLVVARVAHAVGVARTPGIMPLRAGGMVATLSVVIGLSLLLLAQFIS